MLTRGYQKGYTVIELVVVMVVVAILSVFAVTKSVSSAEATLPSQVQKMASDIRHAQLLASTWGQRLRVTAGAGSYRVSCSSAVAPPCPSATSVAITDPATGKRFEIALQKNVMFVNPTTATLDINSLGQPLAAASYTLRASSDKTISVSPLSGLVTVAP